MTTKTKTAAEQAEDRPAYGEPLPMSRQEVFENERVVDERRRRAHAERDGAAATARGRVMAEGAKPLTQEEVDEMEAERVAVARKREKAGEERRATGLARIAAEENARNGRGQEITVRA